MENNKKYQLNLSREVIESIKPILLDMTRINNTQKANRNIRPESVPDWVKAAMRSCVHLTLDSRGAVQLALDKRDDGKLYCTACGRVINQEFDDTAVDKLLAAIDVVNQALIFGLILGLDAKVVNALIATKSILPDICQVMKEINTTVKNDNTVDNSINAVGDEYDFEGGSFTSLRPSF